MTAAAPWSVKGIDPKAREVAKELARRSGMTLGEWLNRVILEDDVPEEVTSEAHFGARPLRAANETPKSFMLTSSAGSESDDLGRIAFALDLLTDRIESSETRAGLAISGVEHSVRHAMARLETAEREQLAFVARLDAAAEQLAAGQASAAERLRHIEDVAGPRSAEAIRRLEETVARAETAGDPAVLIEEVVERFGQRMADAETRTREALDSLRDALAQLDQRMHAADGSLRGDMGQRLEGLAEDLTRRVEDARTEIATRLAASGPERLEERLGQIAADVSAAEQRSARAIETMGREVLSMADILTRRVQSAEQRSAEAIEQVGGEIARIAGAVENRLGRTDQLHAEALERLGAEIGRITDRLTDRIMQSERRAAQAIDDVGEQVAKVTERIEQRHERAAGDLAERLRQSEERTARLLADSRRRLASEPFPEAFPRTASETISEPTREAFSPAAAAPAPDEAAETVFTAAPMVFGADFLSRAEPVNQPALDPWNPAFGEEDFAAAGAFAPIAEAAAETEAEEPAGLELDAAMREAAPALSTREVIEQARATARAVAGPREDVLHAPEPAPRRSRGLFGLKPNRPASTWQTALMVAGGAAFLSVGAAGVVLLEGPAATRQAQEAASIETSPRAALALTPATGPSAPAVQKAPAPAVVEPAAAAPRPDPEATDYIETVRAVEARQPGALAHLKVLADGGWAPAQVYLARLYETGQAGVVQNIGEARRWTARAADAGDPPAMHNLALFLFRGEGGPPDAAAAAQWFKKAAQHGVVDSQYNLGLLYQSGSGVPRDLAQAYKWFLIAANAGDAEARASATELQGKVPAAQLATAETQASAFEPTPGVAVSETPASGLSVTAAQKVLGRLGYYKGRPDGAVSPQLKLAVTAYQRDQGLAATGSLDPTTVARLTVLTR
jgi:localization factor PodJL